MQDLTEDFRNAIENDYTATELNEITSRLCESENYNGIEYNFFGIYVPVRPIIDVVAETDGIAIENMSHVSDGEHICLTVFVANLPEQTHTAFVKP